MNVINNLKYVKAIESFMSLHSLELDGILSRLELENVYLIGGAVRDPIVNLIYGKDLKVSDYDFFVDDRHNTLDFMKTVSDYDNVIFTRFGSPKFIFDDFEMD